MPVKAGQELPKGENRKKTFDVRTVRKMMEKGKSVAEIAEHYGVTRQAIYARLRKDDAKKRKTYDSEHTQLIGVGTSKDYQIDPETGLAVNVVGQTKMIIGRMGDEKVSQFVSYQMDMLQMGMGTDQKDVQTLWQKFYSYLMYCQEHGIFPNNMSCYLALGVGRRQIYRWRSGEAGTPQHKEFAETLASFFASIHEQAGAEQVVNPILSIYWSKAHDGMTDQPKVEVEVRDALGERKSAEEIAAKYQDLPD